MTHWCSIEEAVGHVASGNRVFVQGACATPTPLLQALVARPDLHDVEIIHLHTYGPAPYTEEPLADRFHLRALFVAENTRDAVNAGRASYVPLFLHDIPPLMAPGHSLYPDVALIQVSPPDAHGVCSLGTSVDITRAAVDHAPIIIALVNPCVPRTHGDAFIALERITFAVRYDAPLYDIRAKEPDDIQRQIGRNVATLIEDGATLQLGIGAIPDAVLRELRDHRNLGVHSEMFSDGVIDLVERGVITGARKDRNRGKIVASFAIGSRRLFDFLDDNPMIEMRPVDFTNDAAVIGQFTHMVAINSAIQVDLTGQVCAESIGSRIYSGVGGQMDFLSGAARSPRGRPIIAMPATARAPSQNTETPRELSPVAGLISRIVPELSPGAAVTTTRAHVHYVVSEYGVATLHGKDLAQRARSLIAIAAPEFRDELERAAHDLHLLR
jgi:4-hydroxybutyrate CoA-transferase